MTEQTPNEPRNPYTERERLIDVLQHSLDTEMRYDAEDTGRLADAVLGSDWLAKHDDAILAALGQDTPATEGVPAGWADLRFPYDPKWGWRIRQDYVPEFHRSRRESSEDTRDREVSGDPWKDPQPWVRNGGRFEVQGDPYWRARYEPRTRAQYDAEQGT